MEGENWKPMRLWKCDNGTYDTVDNNGDVVHQNVPEHILAAAPDLLAELTMLSEALDLYMTRHPRNYGFWVNFQPFLTSARAAIAKAYDVDASDVTTQGVR